MVLGYSPVYLLSFSTGRRSDTICVCGAGPSRELSLSGFHSHSLIADDTSPATTLFGYLQLQPGRNCGDVKPMSNVVSRDISVSP